MDLADMIGSYSCLITTCCDALAAHPADSLPRTLVSIMDIIIFLSYEASKNLNLTSMDRI